MRYPPMVAKDPDCAQMLAKRTLTNLYNERPTWLDLAHRKLDEAVFAAYGWNPELGWAGTLLYNERTKHLIDGHARKDLFAGKDKVPVLIGSWSEADEKKILGTLDPLAAMAEADGAKLEALLKQVQTDSDALAQMLEDLAAENNIQSLLNGQTDPDEIPEPPDEPITRPGDMWVLGNHRLLCADSSKPEDVDRLLDGSKVHLVNTDPPYNVKVEPRSNNAIVAGMSSFKGAKHHQRFDVERYPEKSKEQSANRKKSLDHFTVRPSIFTIREKTSLR